MINGSYQRFFCLCHALIHLSTHPLTHLLIHSSSHLFIYSFCRLLEACNPWLMVVSSGIVVSSPASPLVSPKWLGPLLLLLDLFEKVSVSSKRKATVEKFAVSASECCCCLVVECCCYGSLRCCCAGL